MLKRNLGFVLGLLIAGVILVLDFHGLSPSGKVYLALTMMTIVFWATQVVQSGYSSGLYLALLIILGVAKPSEVLAPWIGSTMFLIIGAYLIAYAVENSGLGMRVALIFIGKFANSFRSIILSIFILTLILAVLIPHPWPRAFLIMTVMRVLIRSAGIKAHNAKIIGFTVFAAAVPISMIVLTGDSSINMLAVAASGVSLSWFDWLYYMGPPAIFGSILTCGLILWLFKPDEPIQVDQHHIREQLHELGPISSCEIKTAIWLVIAVVVWLSEALHGIEIGWATLLIAMAMSLPVIGGIIDAKGWRTVPMEVLLFLTAAMSMGKVGHITGANAWIAETFLPSTIPDNIFLLALFIGVISIIIHMLLGSVIAVMGIAIPAMILLTADSGISSLPVALFVFTAISMHYILPFQHLNILVGLGEENGGYDQSHAIKLGLPLTIAVFAVLLFEVIYWQLIGLI